MRNLRSLAGYTADFGTEAWGSIEIHPLRTVHSFTSITVVNVTVFHPTAAEVFRSGPK